MAKINPRRGPTAATLEKADQVIQLRRHGISYRQIAKQLGISHQRAHQLHKVAAETALRENTQEYAQLQEERVELLLRRSFDAERDADDGRDKAALINAALKATDQLSRLRGIYDRTETEAQTAAASLLDTLIETSKQAAAAQTKPEDTEE